MGYSHVPRSEVGREKKQQQGRCQPMSCCHILYLVLIGNISFHSVFVMGVEIRRCLSFFATRLLCQLSVGAGSHLGFSRKAFIIQSGTKINVSGERASRILHATLDSIGISVFPTRSYNGNDASAQRVRHGEGNPSLPLLSPEGTFIVEPSWDPPDGRSDYTGDREKCFLIFKFTLTSRGGGGMSTGSYSPGAFLRTSFSSNCQGISACLRISSESIEAGTDILSPS